MCYILYGAVNKEIDLEDYREIEQASPYSFRPGTKHDVKMAILRDDASFRVTDWVCDCEFPIGSKNPEAMELKELERLFHSFQKAKGARNIYLSKTWAGKRNKTEESVRLADIDVPSFLAEAVLDRLYQIEL